MFVTGSDGFFGYHLAPYLVAYGYRVIAAPRTVPAFQDPNMVVVPLPDQPMSLDWNRWHNAAPSSILRESVTTPPMTTYDRVNHRATEALANAAFRYRANLFFISSIAAQSRWFSDLELTENGTPKPRQRLWTIKGWPPNWRFAPRQFRFVISMPRGGELLRLELRVVAMRRLRY